MRVLSDLEPARVFFYFEQICAIPHGSYNIDAISDYLVDFARNHHLEYIQDEWKNVIISKPASQGYEMEEPVILQGHMDMVAVRDEGCMLDMEKEGLILQHDADYIWAKQTSLGGDDGIAIAYALAILEDDTIPHPALQAVFTVNEEVGMDGALGIDAACLKAKCMLNIDSEEEGILTVGCAGGTKLKSTIRMKRTNQTGEAFRILIDGLAGGHSGTMIHLGRANAGILMARLLFQLREELSGYGISLYLSELCSGDKSNAIPCSAWAVVIVSAETYDGNPAGLLESLVRKEEELICREYAGRETSIHYLVSKAEEQAHAGAYPGSTCGILQQENNSWLCVDEASTRRCIELLLMQPDGVISRNAYMDSQVETSLNMGILRMTTVNGEAVLTTVYELRSSMYSSMQALRNKVIMISENLGGSCEILGEYPQWEYRRDSALQKKMVAVYEEMYGKKPQVTIVHAGLECGIFASKIENLDAVSIGPDILDIHTTAERLDIASTGRVWQYILKILETKEKGQAK